MNVLRALAISFSTYSRLPVPQVRWDGESIRWALPLLPFVGLVLGAVLSIWLRLCVLFSLPDGIKGLGAVLAQIWFTGGIHLDGFCDVCDALASRQSRERMLEIMKDPHIGAFGVTGCVLYLLSAFVLWQQVEVTRQALIVSLLLPALSRALTAAAALHLNNARGGGMLSQVTAQTPATRLVSVVLAVVAAVIMACSSAPGAGAVLVAGLALAYYLFVALKRFQGTTGDLSGWFLSYCELAMLAGFLILQ